MQSQLYHLVQTHRPLFWSVGEENLENLSESAIVEAILNFGDLESVKQLFTILGTQKVADIFYLQQSGSRNNYYPQVSYFFDKYFKRHVQKHS